MKIAILGATGFVGQELVRLLLAHSQVTELHLYSSRLEQAYEQCYRNYLNFNLELQSLEKNNDIYATHDVVFLALPHKTSMQWVNAHVDPHGSTLVIDLSADFRIDPTSYEQWYHTPHVARDFLQKAVYGLSELNRSAIKETTLIANPGCYTTAALLALQPLVKENLLDTNSIICDGKSGISGAGRPSKEGLQFCENNDSLKAYAVDGHRHTPEIEQYLSEAAQSELTISFTPHLIPMSRGILMTSYAQLMPSVSLKEIHATLEKAYANERFVKLLWQSEGNPFPETRWVKGSNECHINLHVDERTNRIVIISALDNLIKGAAGQAIQNMNINLNFHENDGLNLVPLFP